MEKQNCERRAMKRNNLRVEVWKRFENSRYHVIFTNIGTLMDKFVSERRSTSICFTKRYHRWFLQIKTHLPQVKFRYLKNQKESSAW